MNIEHVRALAAVVDEGTVEGGAFVLGITPSATSQRIRTLESRLGQVLIRRTNPITVTEAGEAVLKYAREVELLESEAMDRLNGLAAGADADPGAVSRPRPTLLRIGVNADSLSTWFRPVFAEVAAWDDITLRIEVVDQDKALPLLTSGEVLGTITSASRRGYGTLVEELGTMRYVAVATRSLVDRFGTGPDGRSSGPSDRDLLDPGPGAEVDLRSMPMVKFGHDDDLQLDFLARAGIDVVPPVSVVPSSWEFACAVGSGVGWGLIPVMQLDRLEARDELVRITQTPCVEVPLYWHRWTLSSEKLSRLSATLHRAAATMR